MEVPVKASHGIGLMSPLLPLHLLSSVCKQVEVFYLGSNYAYGHQSLQDPLPHPSLDNPPLCRSLHGYVQQPPAECKHTRPSGVCISSNYLDHISEANVYGVSGKP